LQLHHSAIIHTFNELPDAAARLCGSSHLHVMSGHADKILSLMGEGTFGRVLECWDRKRKETVAIKVIRSVPKYREAAMIEVR
jgi:S-ribosylhomocysteine lyase LuxS involved in autoinducer biosynthesis